MAGKDEAGKNEKEELALMLEAWKVTIQIQQHFNTIEMQIRNIAVTVLTAVVGAAALVYSQTQKVTAGTVPSSASAPDYSIKVGCLRFSSAEMIVFGGIVAWVAFYFMDRWWYHMLLQGAVKHAESIEGEFGKLIPGMNPMGLSSAIRQASHIRLFGKWNIGSNAKIHVFYGIVLLVLILIWAVF
jgi:hypothetical protein